MDGFTAVCIYRHSMLWAFSPVPDKAGSPVVGDVEIDPMDVTREL